MNSFGRAFRVTTYGESHGVAVGGVIDGCPPGIVIDMEAIQADLDRRKPGQSKITTQRKEGDKVELLSGVFEGRTTGTPIGFMVRNSDHHSSDYNNLRDVYRPSHADFTYVAKYGVRDHRGGGRSSARETVARVAAGAIAKEILRGVGVEIFGYVSQVGEVVLNGSHSDLDLSLIESNIVRCPDSSVAKKMIERIEKASSNNDSVGGVVSAVATGVPAGWGEPVFGKLHAELGAAMLGINAVKGFEYGEGFNAASMSGSEHNDSFVSEDGVIKPKTNRSGGVQGGISNGADIYWRTAFKPIATLTKEQTTVNEKGESVTINLRGRHDPCVVSRAVPIVEAMAALVLVDHYLLSLKN